MKGKQPFELITELCEGCGGGMYQVELRYNRSGGYTDIDVRILNNSELKILAKLVRLANRKEKPREK